MRIRSAGGKAAVARFATVSAVLALAILSVGIVLLLPARATPAATPTLTVTPSSAKVGSVIQLAVSGFPITPRQSVAVSLDKTVFVYLDTYGGKAFGSAFVPPAAPGQHVLKAVGLSTGTTAVTSFTVRR